MMTNVWGHTAPGSHPRWGATNTGGAAGISEMLVQSQDGFISLLPALPSAWKSGSLEGFRARDGLSVSLRWVDGKAQSGSLVSDATGEYLLKRPAGFSVLRLNQMAKAI